jgi:peroxiredoxin (alkyl hydroperoxide reductase subunit C)
MNIKLGKNFPHMEVNTTKGKINLPDYFTNKGKGFIFFTHPNDFTPVCTTEFVSFQEKAEQINSLGYELIGLSIDSMADHFSWINWIKENYGVELDFPIIEDLTREISVSLDILSNAHQDTSTTRVVVVVSKDSKIRVILDYPKEIGRNTDEIVRILKALNVHDQSSLYTPSEWPNNKHLNDRLLVDENEIIDDEYAEKLNLSSRFDWFRHAQNIKKD